MPPARGEERADEQGKADAAAAVPYVQGHRQGACAAPPEARRQGSVPGLPRPGHLEGKQLMGILAERARERAREARKDAAALRRQGRFAAARELDAEARRHDARAARLEREGK